MVLSFSWLFKRNTRAPERASPMSGIRQSRPTACVQATAYPRGKGRSSFWHFSDVARCPLFCRCWGTSGTSNAPSPGVTFMNTRVVNELSPSKRDKMIVGGYQSLRDDLASLLPDRSAPLILIKENVCRLLEASLREDGLGRVIYFPSNGTQDALHRH